MALRALAKATSPASESSSVKVLYRNIMREVPRVLVLYDIDMPIKQARSALRYHFRKNAWIKDGRIISLLISKGYMELEETLMQWKQASHLLNVLDPVELKFEEKNTDYEQLCADMGITPVHRTK